MVVVADSGNGREMPNAVPGLGLRGNGRTGAHQKAKTKYTGSVALAIGSRSFLGHPLTRRLVLQQRSFDRSEIVVHFCFAGTWEETPSIEAIFSLEECNRLDKALDTFCFNGG